MLDEATVSLVNPVIVLLYCHKRLSNMIPLHPQAAVDIETDAMLQTTLRSAMFRNRTIITIAHRINTILDSDRIVVLEKGEVAEFASPAELIRRKGLFYDLVREAGLVDRIGTS